ncbi:MAG TPA: hypothetical protein VNB24_01980 [Acidimicrobiales bacterium]|nr:hypothetical protein [Acidimicrobiales bacterium]
MAKKTGTFNRLIGWATGDRRAEAEGKVQEETGHKPDEDEVSAKEHEVRAEHGDFGVPRE